MTSGATRGSAEASDGRGEESRGVVVGGEQRFHVLTQSRIRPHSPARNASRSASGGCGAASKSVNTWSQRSAAMSIFHPFNLLHTHIQQIKSNLLTTYTFNLCSPGSKLAEQERAGP